MTGTGEPVTEPASSTWRGMTLWPPRAAAEALFKRRLARDVFFLQASNTFQKGYSFAFGVVATHTIGVTGYGQYSLVGSLYQTVNLLGALGLGQFIVVPLAQAVAAGDREETAQSAGYNLKLSAVIGLLVLIAALGFGPWFGDVIMHRPEIGAWMRIMALAGIPAVLYNTCTTSLQACRRMRDLALVENVDAIAARTLGVGAMVAGRGVTGLLWGTTIAAFLSTIFALHRYHRVAVREHGFPALPALLRAAWQVPIGKHFRLSSVAAVDKNVAQTFSQTPMLFLGRWAGPREAAYLALASNVFALMASFHGAASKALSVRLSQELKSRGAASTRRLFWRASLIWGSISIVGSLALIGLLPLFRWLYGPDALPSLALVLILAVITAKQGFTVAFGSIFLIMDRVVTNALMKLPIIAISLPIGVLLVQRWAAVGAAGYQLISYLIGDALYFTLLATPWFWRGGANGRQAPPQAFAAAAS